MTDPSRTPAPAAPSRDAVGGLLTADAQPAAHRIARTRVAGRMVGRARNAQPLPALGALLVLIVIATTGCGDDDTAAGTTATGGTGSAEVADNACAELSDLGPDEAAATFTVSGDEATMSGVIDASTPCSVDALLRDHPSVDTIFMVDVPGSANDDANLEAARMVRHAELTTVVPADGAGVASGGTDFFAAGVERIAETGAFVGVHSWATGDGLEGADLPDDDPEHDLYLDYYTEMGIPTDFYWFTLDAAPADDIYDMTDDELLEYEIATAVESR